MSYLQFAVVAALVIGLAMSCSDDQEQVEEAVQQESGQEEVYAQEEQQEEDVDLIEEEVEELASELETPVVEEPALVEEPAPALEFGDYWVFVPQARVRAQPQSSAQVVGTMKYGEKFTPTDKQDGWISNGSGWIPVHNLTDRKTGFAKKANIYYVKQGNVMVHSAPDANSSAVSKITKGERVIITGRKGGWWEVGEGRYIPRDNLVRSRPAH